MPSFAGIREIDGQRSGDGLLRTAVGVMEALAAGDSPPWCEADAGIALAVATPVSGGAFQPQGGPHFSTCGRYVLTADGEIYNPGEIAGQLREAGRPPKEVSQGHLIVEAAAAWGIGPALRRLDGGVSGVFWDRQQQILHLFRDRFGRFPLYWRTTGRTTLFASQLRAFRAHPDFRAELDQDMIAVYLRRRYIPGPRTIYRGVSSLEPGCVLSIDATGSQTVQHYYALEDVVRAGAARRFAGSDDEAMNELDRLLRGALARRIESGLAGVFLSGGIDSSLLLALGRSLAPGRLISLGVGFRETEYDESIHASAVARHLGVAHESVFVSGNDARESLAALPEICDQPLADASLLPTLLLARLAGGRVRAAITGDGAEPFGLYNRYLSMPALLRYIERMPTPVRDAMKSVIAATPYFPWSRIPVELPVAAQPLGLYEKARLLARLFAGDADAAYRMAVSYWHDPDVIMTAGREPAEPVDFANLKQLIPDSAERLEFAGMASIMPGCVLPKIAWASAASGLAIRSPFLDERLIAFGWSLPRAMKLRADTNKWLLRQLLYRHVPRTLVDRPKTGFDVPVGEWLRGPLRSWAEALLDERRLIAEGIFHPAAIRRRWREHLAGRRNWQSSLWVILMFQAWKEHWLP